jgi:hypothetical protein
MFIGILNCHEFLARPQQEIRFPGDEYGLAH